MADAIRAPNSIKPFQGLHADAMYRRKLLVHVCCYTKCTTNALAACNAVKLLEYAKGYIICLINNVIQQTATDMCPSSSSDINDMYAVSTMSDAVTPMHKCTAYMSNSVHEQQCT